MTQPHPVAFKEWSPIVEALGSGSQILFLRKGGIAEGPGGFKPEHDRFWLYPTAFHAAPGKLKPQAPHIPSPGENPEPLRYFAEVRETHWLEDPLRLAALDPFHFWAPEELAKRWTFGKRPGLYTMIVRVFRLPSPVGIPDHPSHHGCKSWIPLESAPSTEGLLPVLDDDSFKARCHPIHQALAIPGSSLKT